MSKYTTTIYEVLLSIVPDGFKLTPDELVEQGVPLFFDFDFPWYTDDETLKKDFEKMYLIRYLNNEIGQETLGLHKQLFKGVMCENVEMMKQKFQLLSAMQNVGGQRQLLHNENVDENENRDTTAEQKINTSDTHNRKQDTQSIHSENPQVTFAQNDYASDMDRGEATAEDHKTVISNSNGTTNDKRTGKILRDLSEVETDTRESDKYFKAIQAGVYLINTELLNKCRKLFMQLW